MKDEQTQTPSKSTMIELVDILTARNTEGKYNDLISNAKAGYYHDFKQPDNAPAVPPKLLLYHDLAAFGDDLSDILEQVKDGEFDEQMDDEDKAKMHEELADNPALRKILGL